jgi:KUP system potassium uptake protein
MVREPALKGIIKSMGIVFGDIGTSPIYTITVVFLFLKPTPENVMGVLSLMVWTMTILVTVEYAWLAMSLGKKGEGGDIVLMEILTGLLRSSRQMAFVTMLTIIGVSLLIGDGVITPAISILSAVEGLLLVPGLERTSQNTLVVIAALIAVGLFAFQKKGTEKVARFFGPVMVIWFSVLALSGTVSIAQTPAVVKSLNPYYAAKFILDNGMVAFFVLSEVILCATGGEALYADMGHLGREPIRRAWGLVFVALIISYYGQGSYLLTHPGAKNILFEMVYSQASFLYVPFLLLSVTATIIASQAIISGMFSIVYQGITTRIMPLFKIEYTSAELRSQIYIAFVNWFLLVSVLFIMFEFRQSHRLAAAYGLAVTGTMTISGSMMTWIFLLRKKFLHSAIALSATLVAATFLLSNMTKIPHGGYWSIVIASIPLFIIVLYRQGQKRLYRKIKPIPAGNFLEMYNAVYPSAGKIKGTALFFAKDPKEIPPYIAHTMFINGILYEDNIIVSVLKRDDPFGVTGFFLADLAPGLRAFEIQAGYMEVFDVEELLMEAGIDEKAIFYGLEEIVTRNLLWKIFSGIKRLTPAFVRFYNLPPDKLHGVVTRVKM